MAFRVEAVRVLEKLLAVHDGEVVDHHNERVGGVEAAVGSCNGLVGVTFSRAETGGGPETEDFLDDGEGVGDAVEEVGVFTEELCSGSRVFAEDVVVFRAELVEGFGVVDQGCVDILESVSIAAGCI